MSAKSDIIRNLHQIAGTHQDECRQLRQELYEKGVELSEIIAENYRLKDRVLLQHSSWMLCDQCHKEDVAKLQSRITALEDHCAEGEVIIVEFTKTLERIHGWNFFQALVAKIFKL